MPTYSKAVRDMTSPATQDRLQNAIKYSTKLRITGALLSVYGVHHAGTETAIHAIFARWRDAFYTSVGAINMCKTVIYFQTIICRVQQRHKLFMKSSEGCPERATVPSSTRSSPQW